jgi:hypothetical protein
MFASKLIHGVNLADEEGTAGQGYCGGAFIILKTAVDRFASIAKPHEIKA